MTTGILSTLIIFVIFGCFSEKQKPLNLGKINVSRILENDTLSSSEKAEQLAKSAEQLITVQGFVYADNVADMALNQDPNNLRAKFLKALLGPIMVQKGILTRIAPIANRNEQWTNDYQQMLADINTKYPNTTIKTFFSEGRADIQSENDVQNYIDSLVNRFEELRHFAKNHKNENLTIAVSDSFFSVMKKRFANACVVIEIGPSEYAYECPSPLNIFEVSLNRADFEGLQQIAAAYELYLSLYNSYNLTGAIQVIINNKDILPKSKAEKIIDDLLKDKKFATLRNNHGFKKIKEMGVDAVSGIRWVLENQESLCPKGVSDHRNRIGFLFDNGICITKESDRVNTETSLKEFDDALKGKEVAVNFKGINDQEYKTSIRPSALIDSPITDLRILTPIKIDQCNQLIEVAEQSVGGLFPRSDANNVLKNNTCL